MPIREIEIRDYARELLRAHGDKAVAEAAQRAQACDEKHQPEQAQTWRQVIAALRGMRAPHAS